MTAALLVALGAAVGAPLRYLVGEVLRRRFGAAAVAATLTVNVAGSFVLGLLAGADVAGGASLLVGVGFCGAFTTFSTLALELWQAYADGRPRDALTNLALTLGLGLGAAWLGWLLAS